MGSGSCACRYASLSGRKFVRVQQPDRSVELAEIVLSAGDGDGDRDGDGDETTRDAPAGVVDADGGETSL